MKRIINALLFVISLSVLLSTTAFAAENNKYHLDELGMSISIPDELAVFTRDTKANDPNLKLFGHTKESMLSIMESGSIYLNALDRNGEYEIVVTMAQSPFEDFSLLSDTSLTALSSTFANTYEKAGATFIDSEVYLRNGAKYLKINSSQIKNGSTIYSSHFTTAHMGKLINITVHSNSGEVKHRLNSLMLTGIVDSIVFDIEPTKPDAPSFSSPAFTYTDINSGTTFTVPENWTESPMNEEREYLDAKFTSNLEEGLCIFYTSEDILDNNSMAEAGLTSFEKFMISRTAVDNSIFTTADVAAMWGVVEADISMVTYGGNEYYSTETEASGSSYGLAVSVPVVHLLRCENGYMYMFQFYGPRSSAYFKDFEVLVSSVEYPNIKDGMLIQRRVIGIVFLVMLAALVALSIWLWHIQKKRKQAKAASLHISTPIDQTEGIVNKVPASIRNDDQDKPGVVSDTLIAFCHKCGGKVESGSRFCHKCGATISTKEEK